MDILVFGGGALGSLVAARLSERNEVTLIGRRDHVEAIQQRGLRITGRTQANVRTIRARVEIDREEQPEFILVTTKAHQTSDAVEQLKPFAENAIFVSLQNGLGNEETMSAVAPRVLGAVINQGVTFLDPGVVHHAGEGATAFGPFQGTSDQDAERLASAFRAAGMKASAVPDIITRIWAKAVLNAAVNPLTALLSRRTGELLDDPDLMAAIDAIVRESVVIAQACDVELDAAALLDTIRAVAAATKGNKSSMLQDLERGRNTEIHAINGALVQRAREHGLEAPRNQLLVHLISSAERDVPGPEDATPP